MVYLAGPGLALGLVAFALGRGRARAAVAVLVGLGAVAVPLGFRQQATSVPPIHDVSTDPGDTLAFETLAKQRQPTDNPVTPPEPDVVAQQKAAYPDVQPLLACGVQQLIDRHL